MQESRADDVFNKVFQCVTKDKQNLYPHQEEAILELCANKHVILKTPTGSGKSLVAVAAHQKGLATDVRSFYTSPIKALVSEKFFQLCHQFGKEQVGMQTGDANINPNAFIVCCTAEILSRLSLTQAVQQQPLIVVMDEFHYYNDKERGLHWQLPLLTLPRAQFLLMSATLGDTQIITTSLTLLTGHKVAEVISHQRPVPLHYRYQEALLHEVLTEAISSNAVPIYVVQFTQRSCLETAQDCLSLNCCNKSEKKQLSQILAGFRFDTPFGKDIRKFLGHGIGLHHAGLLPKYRLLVEHLSQLGLLKIIFGTDTLGVGINVPIRTVLFVSLCKFDGKKTTHLSNQQFMQIAGRAGRAGFDQEGYCIALAPNHVTLNKRAQSQVEAGKKRKIVLQKAPKHFLLWDEQTFIKLQHPLFAPMQSCFEVSNSLILEVLSKQPSHYRYLVQLIQRCHDRPAQKKRHLRQSANWLRTLLRAGLVINTIQHDQNGRNVRVLSLHPDLQHDFAVHQGLSLFIIDTLEKGFYTQDNTTATPLAALDCISLIESTLEQPFAVLHQQRQYWRKVKLAELRHEDLSFEERNLKLDEIDYPKPNAELLYTIFNAYKQSHPYVSEETVRPKSIGREMFEQYAAFNDYIITYQLAASEGILLRYLNTLYKTLVQTVPQHFWSDSLLDVIGYLRTLLQTVDRSLLVAWENLDTTLSPSSSSSLSFSSPAPSLPVPRIQNWQSRIRFSLYGFCQAWANQDGVGASTFLTPASQEHFSTEQLQLQAAHFCQQYDGPANTTPLARSKHWSEINNTGDLFTIRHTLLDKAGEPAGVLVAEAATAKLAEDELVLLDLQQLIF